MAVDHVEMQVTLDGHLPSGIAPLVEEENNVTCAESACRGAVLLLGTKRGILCCIAECSGSDVGRVVYCKLHHQRAVRCITVHGDMVATGGDDAVITVSSLSAVLCGDAPTSTYRYHTLPVTCIVLRDDRLYSVGLDGVIAILKLKDGSLPTLTALGSSLTVVGLSSDESYAVALGRKGFLVDLVAGCRCGERRLDSTVETCVKPLTWCRADAESDGEISELPVGEFFSVVSMTGGAFVASGSKLSVKWTTGLCCGQVSSSLGTRRMAHVLTFSSVAMDVPNAPSASSVFSPKVKVYAMDGRSILGKDEGTLVPCGHKVRRPAEKRTAKRDLLDAELNELLREETSLKKQCAEVFGMLQTAMNAQK